MADHKFWNALAGEGFTSGPASALFILFFIYFFYLFISGPIISMFAGCCKCCFVEEMQIDEQIDLYQNCLDDDDRDWTIKEEENMEHFGIQCMFKDTMDKLKSGDLKNDNMHLIGCHTYDLLRNPEYIKKF